MTNRTPPGRARLVCTCGAITELPVTAGAARLLVAVEIAGWQLDSARHEPEGLAAICPKCRAAAAAAITVRCRECKRERQFLSIEQASEAGWDPITEGARYVPGAIDARCPECRRAPGDRVEEEGRSKW